MKATFAKANKRLPHPASVSGVQEGRRLTRALALATHPSMTKDPFYIAPGDSPSKRRILQEGLRLFAQHGMSATTIRDIAKATGFSNPALYKHFRTKEELAVILFRLSYAELLKRMTLAVKDGDGFAAAFSRYVAAFSSFYDEYPDAALFTLDNIATLWPQVSGEFHGRTIVTLTRELLDLGKQEGLVSTDDRTALQLVVVTGTLIQLVRQLYLGALSGPAMAQAAGIERILRACLA